jgi:class 3 adenylate cyclase
VAAVDEAVSTRIDRSFAFVDLCGFTDFVDTSGDEAAIEELEVLRSTTRRVASRCGVRIDKWLGDGAMMVGTDIAPTVLAVVTIKDRMAEQSSRLAMRAGIARGQVILHEGDNYVGRAVNLAARLCDHAEAGVILASVDGLELPDGVSAGPELSVHVKGLARPATCVSLHDADGGGPPG